MAIKQLESTEKKIGEATFYIRPFPAFTAANISGELSSLVAPMLSGIAPLIGNIKVDQNGVADLMDMQVEDALPSLTNAFAGLSGDKFERLMKQLLINNKNISVCSEEATNGETKLLTLDLANEVFCGEVQDMYILCFEVIRINYKGFFKKLGSRFGILQKIMGTKNQTQTQNQVAAPGTANGESST